MKMMPALTSRLKRATQAVPSKWAEQCVVVGKPFPGPYGYRYHPWSEAMINSEAEVNVGMKAAQMGYSLSMLCRSLYLIDIAKESVLYLLPTKSPDATDFSSTRFDPLLAASEHLQNLFSDVKNVGTKRAGSATLYVRGSNSRSGLKSIPVSSIIFDELDEMDEKNVALARQRTAGQRRSHEWYVSTPTAPGHGVDELHAKSNKQRYFFPCPSCGRFIDLTFDNLVVTEDPKDAYLKCGRCDIALTDPKEDQSQLTERKASWYERAEWVAENDSHILGWSVNQAYSCAVAGNPSSLAEGYHDSHTSKSREQEYWTSRWGFAYEVEGARITDEAIINAATGPPKQPSSPPSAITTMGVDVGSYLHIVIVRWHPKRDRTNDRNKAADAEVLLDKAIPTNVGFHELDDYMRNYNVRHCVIDANPERSSAAAFAKRFWGWVHLCYYGRGITSPEMSINKDRHTVTVDRTQWMDQALGRFGVGSIILPRNISAEFRKHITAVSRRYEEDGQGNMVGKYLNNGDDHFAHSLTYAEIALPLAPA